MVIIWLFRISASPQILMKLGLFDAFLREMKESGRETWWIASRSELLFVKVDDY